MTNSDSRTVFYSAHAQHDNLGDLVIRRAGLRAVVRRWERAVVYVGAMPEGYISALGAPQNVVLVRSSREFQARFVSQAFRGRADLVFAPGPVSASRTPMSTAVSARNLMMTSLVRFSGGFVGILGRAIRSDGGPALAFERLTARLAQVAIVRDQISSQLLGPSVLTLPDMAFADRSSLGGCSRYLVLSFRGDRVVSEGVMARALVLAENCGLAPILVTQVGRDDQQHQTIAERYGIAHCNWGPWDHQTQLSRVERVYRSSAGVVSNRLHSIILGARRGAVPVLISRDPDDKVYSTLRDVLPLQFLDGIGTTSLAEMRNEVWQAASAASDELGSLDSMLRHPVVGG